MENILEKGLRGELNLEEQDDCNRLVENFNELKKVHAILIASGKNISVEELYRDEFHQACINTGSEFMTEQHREYCFQYYWELANKQ